MIDASGSKAQMAAKLYKKDGKNLITEEHAIAFCNHHYYLRAEEETLEAGFEDLHEWRKEVDDMK